MRTLFSVILAFSVLSLSAQVVVRGEGEEGNPTVLFNGISENPALAKQVLSDLRNCGWFQVVNGGKPDYAITGHASGNTLRLDVANGAGLPLYTITEKGSDNVKLAHTTVDALLKQTFGVAGICRTKIVFSAQTNPRQQEIYICDFDGTNLKRLTANASLSIEPSWHPDGRSIIYNQFLTSSTPLVQYDMVRNRARSLSNMPGINSGKISPDGRSLALIVRQKGQSDLYVRRLEGGSLTRLTNDKAVEATPAWSPDSNYICFVSDRSGRPQLYIIDIRNKSVRKVTGQLGSESVAPNWGKDNKLAYSAKLGGSYVLKIIDLSQTMGFPRPASGNTRIANENAPAVVGENASWAPDNRHVVISSRGKICIVDTRTNKVKVLIAGKSKCSGASWSGILY